METTVGQVIINDMLPEDMRDYNRVWDKKTKGKVLTDLARRHPDQFKEVSHNLLRFGAKAAYETGGQSFGIEDIAPTQISRDFQRVMNKQLQDILKRLEFFRNYAGEALRILCWRCNLFQDRTDNPLSDLTPVFL